MHEFSLLQLIYKSVDEIAKENQLVSVSRVKIKFGALRQVVPDFFRFAFQESKGETILKDAVLDLETLPIIMQCRSCRHEFQVEEHSYICPQCQGVQLDILQGNELLIESIEGEQEQSKG